MVSKVSLLITQFNKLIKNFSTVYEYLTYLCNSANSSLTLGARVNESNTSLENTSGAETGASFLRTNQHTEADRVYTADKTEDKHE